MPPAPLALPQYSLRKILLIWAAVALPMPIMAFWLAPRVAALLGWNGMITLWAALILGMAWQFVLSCLLLRPEMAEARRTGWLPRLWVQAPRTPVTHTPNLRLLAWVLPVVLAGALVEQTPLADLLAAPLLWLAPVLASVPEPQLEALRAPEFVGAWWLVAMALVSALFNYVLGEELLFRGVLLPRSQAAFGRHDWLANAVLFACYHLIRPLTVPAILVSTAIWVFPARRYRSIWFALIPHAIEGVFMMVLITGLVAGLIPV